MPSTDHPSTLLHTRGRRHTQAGGPPEHLPGPEFGATGTTHAVMLVWSLPRLPWRLVVGWCPVCSMGTVALTPGLSPEHPVPDGHREDQRLLPAGCVLQPAGRHVPPDPVGWPGGHEAQHGAHGLARVLEGGGQPFLLEELCWWVTSPTGCGCRGGAPGCAVSLENI